MKKIEKLVKLSELHIEIGGESYYTIDQKDGLEMFTKINEIIEALNELKEKG